MTVILAGLAMGAIYVLTACGFNIVFVTTSTFNFAQAQFMMVGTFVAYWTSAQLKLPVEWAFLFGAGIGLVLGIIEERIALRPIMARGPQAQLITTIALGVMLDGAASIIWGTQPLPVPFFGSSKPVQIFGGTITPVQLITIIVGIMIPLLLELWSRRTLTGLASLASAEDRQAAMARGINVPGFALWSVAGASAFAGMLGPLLGPQTYAVFNVGDTLAITAFVALAVGGFGSYLGALVGGFSVGLIESLTLRYLSALYQDIMVFAFLFVVLMARPAGLFRKHTERAV